MGSFRRTNGGHKHKNKMCKNKMFQFPFYDHSNNSLRIIISYMPCIDG